MRKAIFELPKFTIMQNITSIEVKCECRIPFHEELVSYLQDSLDTNNADTTAEMPYTAEIRQALYSRMIFIKIVNPFKDGRKKLLAAVKRMLKKDLVGTIKVGKDEITFIMM